LVASSAGSAAISNIALNTTKIRMINVSIPVAFWRFVGRLHATRQTLRCPDWIPLAFTDFREFLRRARWQTNCSTLTRGSKMPLLYLVLTLIVVAVIAGVVNTSARTPDRIKPLVNMVLTLIVVGMALWLINTYVPMAESIKAILNIVVVVGCCVLVLQTVGLWDRVVDMWTGMWARITKPRPPANPEASQGKT
jgi:hypothetical protein